MKRGDPHLCGCRRTVDELYAKPDSLCSSRVAVS
jgi:hypothetical protein